MLKERDDLKKEYAQLMKDIEDPEKFEKVKDRMASVASALTKSKDENLV